ncbi:glycoside hydrolase family 26 protein [Paenibacillus sp. FJAT-27812]|uniref:glycoside hydrolase family 26 protein n=1 Tax=Paenibacillus sp. FJAT-27812 TaxID=1684143 RepID=UPI0006A77D06|nr:glycosyl hydrolase [Paenibacillus sp. FJAT-27812]
MEQYTASPSSAGRSRRKRLFVFVFVIAALLQAVPSVEGAPADRHSRFESPELKVAPKEDWTVHFIPSEPSYKLANAEPVEGVYLGAYVLQDAAIGYSMHAFNERTGKQHASFFKYVGFGKPFPSEWVEEVKAVGAFPHIAWEPNKGLDEVKDAAYIRSFAEQAKQAGVPVFLRFASEMNGTWTNYSGDPEAYKRSWRMVHNLFAEHAPNVVMVWTVLTFPMRTIESFYPGDAYVDWVGVNVYNVKYHNGDKVHQASDEDPLDLINYVYNRFSRTKPIQLSEFGVTHYNTTDGQKDNSFAINRISRLYRHLRNDYPRVKAVFYFDVNNVEAYNEARKVNDYSITSDQELLEAYRKATESEHFLSKMPDAQSLPKEPVEQRFTYRGYVFRENGITYVDEQFFSRVMQLQVKLGQDRSGAQTARIFHKDGTMAAMAPVKVIQRKIWTGTKTRDQRLIYRNVQALPLKQTAKGIGYEVNLYGNNIYIQE